MLGVRAGAVQATLGVSLGLALALGLTRTMRALLHGVAPTDPARVRRSDPGNPDVCLIFDYHKLFSDLDTIQMVDRECRTAGIGCVDCKKKLMEGVTAHLTPLQQRAEELRADPDYVRDALRQGNQEARAIASGVMEEVREKVGFLKV